MKKRLVRLRRYLGNRVLLPTWELALLARSFIESITSSCVRRRQQEAADKRSAEARTGGGGEEEEEDES